MARKRATAAPARVLLTRSQWQGSRPLPPTEEEQTGEEQQPPGQIDMAPLAPPNWGVLLHASTAPHLPASVFALCGSLAQLLWGPLLVLVGVVMVEAEQVSSEDLWGCIQNICLELSARPAQCLGALMTNVFILLTLRTQQWLSSAGQSARLGHIVQCGMLVALLVTPVAATFFIRSLSMHGALANLLLHVILLMKLTSYALINHTHRARDANQDTNEGADGETIRYPANLNLKDLYYFMLAPTLCYQINYPKATHFRLPYFLYLCAEVGLGCWAIVAIVQKVMLPEIHSHMMDDSRFRMYFLKLALANLGIWLIFSYVFFHSWLNALAEVLYFDARQFYLDWWNAKSIVEFWNKWNRPAYNWLSHHVYMPLKTRGYNKLYLKAAIFLISALSLEGLLAIPLRMYKFLICPVMFTQFLLDCILQKVLGDRFGKTIVGLNMMFGPLLVFMLYFHDYYVAHSHVASI